LDNYRSLGSALPLRKPNLFEYLPPASAYLAVSRIMPYHIPVFTPINSRRIDLTPGVVVSFHRYRRTPSTITRKIKTVQKKVISVPKSLKPVINKRRSMIHKITTKKHFSHQLTELIQTNNKQLILNEKLQQERLIINSTRKWKLPITDINQLIPIRTNE
jgi:hypothetical protein